MCHLHPKSHSCNTSFCPHNPPGAITGRISARHIFSGAMTFTSTKRLSWCLRCVKCLCKLIIPNECNAPHGVLSLACRPGLNCIGIMAFGFHYLLQSLSLHQDKEIIRNTCYGVPIMLTLAHQEL